MVGSGDADFSIPALPDNADGVHLPQGGHRIATRVTKIASGIVSQPGDGKQQDRAQHQPNHRERGEHEDLPAFQPGTPGIIEELREFLVDRDHGKKLRQTGETTPDRPIFLRRRDGPPKQRRAGQPEHKYPRQDFERVGANAVAGHRAERGLQKARTAQRLLARGLALALAAEIADIIAGIAVAGVRECGGELSVGSWTVVGIEPRPIVPGPNFLPARLRSMVSLESTEVTEREAVETELSLCRPGAFFRIDEIAGMRVAQVQGARFSLLCPPGGGFMHVTEL